MRFCLTLQLKERFLTVEYRRIILSFIKNALTKYDNGKYYEDFFKDTKQKDYCFSVILPKPIFTNDKVIIDKNEIKIIFSMKSNLEMTFILFNAFIEQINKQYPLPNNNLMVLKNINKEKQQEIINSKVIFRTAVGSGICVRNHDKEKNTDTYYVYNDKEFREKIKVVLSNQLLNSGFTEEEVNEVNINPIQCKKVVVKHYKRYIDTSVGLFEIKANNKILQHLYEVGVGSRKSMGFGLMDLVTQDLL
ncbi:CRISPR-associated endoribonuclease Cas6 [Clostridium sp. C8]|uniref:CRISPR-associated endoribonuclease Cas6 n=1 Tax=Clostridium sp. C8 TaxID=1667357 RepID=UPI00062E60C2|nr:CRISPR-associated endoribonuclease Cas6 [Clostridium sp. C8]KLE16526.1 CRISPR-associated protein Cas6 [Clostridium sp. C8]